MGPVITSEQFRRILTDASSLLGETPRTRWPSAYTCEIVGAAIVTVMYDHGRLGEVIISVRQPYQVEPAFEIADILRTTDCPPEESSQFEAVQTFDDQVLEDVVRRAFGSLIRHGRVFLSGDTQVFEEARIQRSRRALIYTSSINDSLTLEAADDAWRHGDFAEVAGLLAPIEARLSVRDQRRLAFARGKTPE